MFYSPIALSLESWSIVSFAASVLIPDKRQQLLYPPKINHPG